MGRNLWINTKILNRFQGYQLYKSYHTAVVTSCPFAIDPKYTAGNLTTNKSICPELMGLYIGIQLLLQGIICLENRALFIGSCIGSFSICSTLAEARHCATGHSPRPWLMQAGVPAFPEEDTYPDDLQFIYLARARCYSFTQGTAL